MNDLKESKEIGPQVQEVFTLKHNGNLHEVGYEELIALAQKGMDYDRIRCDRDECRQKIKMMEEQGDAPKEQKVLAAEDFADGEMMLAEGFSNIDGQAQGDAARERWDFGELLRRYPEVGRYRSFEALPQGFIEGLEEGLSPAEAWQEYLLARQELRLTMLERERANRRAAAPDVRSSGRYEEDGFVKALFGR